MGGSNRMVTMPTILVQTPPSAKERDLVNNDTSLGQEKEFGRPNHIAALSVM